MKLRLSFVKYIFLLSVILSSFTVSSVSAIDENFYQGNDIVFYDKDATVCSGDIGASVILSGNDNIEKVLNYLMQKGLSLAQASGFIGNMQQESGVNPKAVQPGSTTDDPNYSPVSGPGFGLVQWTFPARQQPLVDLARSKNLPIIDLGVQMDYVWQELTTGYKSTLDKVKGTENPVEAAVIVHDTYEVSADDDAKVRRVRGGAAQEVYDKYKDAPPVGGATTPSGATSTSIGSADGGASSDKKIVVIDPGHGPAYSKIDPITGLSMSETPNRPEANDVFDVANRVKTMLEQKGYTVILTKNSVDQDVDFRQRADIINNSGAAIGIDIHTTPAPGKSQATPQVVGAYRTFEDKRAEFTNADTATKSQAYAKAIAESRTEIEGHPVTTDPITFGEGRAEIKSKGNIPLISLFSDKVPFVYNEIARDPGTPFNNGSDSLTDEGKQKYAEGITQGIEKATPSTGTVSGDGCSGSSAATGNLSQTVTSYAWPNYRGLDDKSTDGYQEAWRKAGDGVYRGAPGASSGDIGIDCGAFVTRLLIDSGFEPNYNYGGKSSAGAGNTISQEKWMKENWQSLGTGGTIDAATLAPGDVAINDNHTFVYVGDVPGFESKSKIASASLGERAPMSDNQSATDASFNWYRKK